MNLNKNISVWRGSDTPPTEYHLWVKDGLLYIYSDGQWKELVLTTCQNQIKDLYECKQDTLVSGVNIKTINDQSLLGEGNIVVEAPIMTDYAKLNGDNVFTGNNSFSNAVTVKGSWHTITVSDSWLGFDKSLKISGNLGTAFRFIVDDSIPLAIYKDYLWTHQIRNENYNFDYLILNGSSSELSLNGTKFTPKEIKYKNKTIPLADIVVTSDLEEVENVAATINERLTKLEKDISTILESINNGNS